MIQRARIAALVPLAGTALGAGFALGLVCSTTLLAVRLSNGTPRTAFAASVLVAGVVAVVFILTRRRFVLAPVLARALAPHAPLALACAQVCGIAIAVALVHVAARPLEWPWLIEGPRQLVNDAVATSGIIVIMRAFRSPRLGFGSLIVSLVLLTTYAATAASWHVDRSPTPFDVDVQHVVVTQVLCAAIALFAMRISSFLASSR